MGLFQFLESGLIISLAITFVLSVLLVYYFRQRINEIEHKVTSMFEVICILSENAKKPQVSSHSSEYHLVGGYPISHSRIPVSDSSDTTSDTTSESDNEDDDCSMELYDVVLQNKEISSDADDADDEQSLGYEILDDKVVIHNCEILEESIEMEEHEIHLVDNYKEEHCEEEHCEEEQFHLEEPVTTSEQPAQESSHVEDVDDIQIEEPEKDYKKMTLPFLRQLAINRGFTQDLSKMKKNELIALLS